MSAFVFDTHLSYADYLQAKAFVGDLSEATRDAGRAVSMNVARQTREIIASQETLAREHIEVQHELMQQIEDLQREQIEVQEKATREITRALSDGFEMLSYGLSEISWGISDLKATFHWGFSEMIAQIGHMKDTLSDLLTIAKTPVQTAAYNHFEIARDAFRQGLYKEALDELAKAVEGDHTSPGYKIEWRFHQLRGVIRLGFADCDMTLVDLAAAEESFLAAARYARKDYAEDAGRAFLSAGWAAYCQGKMVDAVKHTTESLKAHPGLGEAYFQCSKIVMAMGHPEKALPLLGKAIDCDPFFALKAAGDGDFKKQEGNLRAFLEFLCKEKFKQVSARVIRFLEPVTWKEFPEDFRRLKSRAEQFLAEGISWPLLDIIHLGVEFGSDGAKRNLREEIARHKTFQDIASRVSKLLAKISSHPKKRLFSGRKPELQGFLETGGSRKRGDIESFWEKCEQDTKRAELWERRKVLDRPAGFLRKAQYREEAGPPSSRKILYSLSLDLVLLDGPTTTIEFVRVPEGQFLMGEKVQSHKVTITKPFMLGRYPVTQIQWEAVMGINPSRFKGDGDLPVGRVPWDGAQNFIRRLNAMAGENAYRLPTEAEWEYACRAGTTTKYSFGGDPANLGTYAWYGANASGVTHIVGQKLPNAWGLYDMHGNVWEWCNDWYGEYSSSSANDPEGPSEGSYRVLRGGGFYSDGSYCRSADRYYFYPDGSLYSSGFRVVRVLPAR